MVQPELLVLGRVSALPYKVWKLVVSRALLRGLFVIGCGTPREMAVESYFGITMTGSASRIDEVAPGRH
jgi:hypothetical protein